MKKYVKGISITSLDSLIKELKKSKVIYLNDIQFTSDEILYTSLITLSEFIESRSLFYAIRRV